MEQYRQLGIPRFSELYVRGFLNGGSYEAIPLEVNAYTLGGRFEGNPAIQFAVADEVRKWAAEGRLWAGMNGARDACYPSALAAVRLNSDQTLWVEVFDN